MIYNICPQDKRGRWFSKHTKRNHSINEMALPDRDLDVIEGPCGLTQVFESTLLLFLEYVNGRGQKLTLNCRKNKVSIDSYCLVSP